MAYIYRLIIISLFLFFTSVSHSSFPPLLEWVNSNEYDAPRFPSAEAACVDLYKKRPSVNVIGVEHYLFNNGKTQSWRCLAKYCSNDGSCQTSTEYVVSRKFTCPDHSLMSSPIYNINDPYCYCESGFFEVNGSCSSIPQCPVGATWNDDAKSCLCSDGLQPWGDLCGTVPGSGPDEDILRN